MTAEVETEEEGAKVATGGGRRRLIIIIGGAVLALLVVGGALYFFLGIGRAETGAAASAADGGPQTFIFNLPEMTVNLNTGGHGEQFMKLTVALEVNNQAMMTEIQPRMAKVVDAFQVYLRELRPDDLQGSAGIYRLKEELLRRVNVAIAPAEIDGILFKEILVQ